MDISTKEGAAMFSQPCSFPIRDTIPYGIRPNMTYGRDSSLWFRIDPSLDPETGGDTGGKMGGDQVKPGGTPRAADVASVFSILDLQSRQAEGASMSRRTDRRLSQ